MIGQVESKPTKSGISVTRSLATLLRENLGAGLTVKTIRKGQEYVQGNENNKRAEQVGKTKPIGGD